MGRWFIGAAACGFAFLIYVYLTLPDVRPLRASNPTTTAFMELRAQEARAAGRPVRVVQQWAGYSRISPQLTRAVLVARTMRSGSTRGSTSSSFRNRWRSTGRARTSAARRQHTAAAGQESVSRPKNPVRKLRLLIARRLEAELPKSRILELYLNVIEWGDGIYGAEAAARTYFHTSAAALGPRRRPARGRDREPSNDEPARTRPPAPSPPAVDPARMGTVVRAPRLAAPPVNHAVVPPTNGAAPPAIPSRAARCAGRPPSRRSSSSDTPVHRDPAPKKVELCVERVICRYRSTNRSGSCVWRFHSEDR